MLRTTVGSTRIVRARLVSGLLALTAGLSSSAFILGSAQSAAAAPTPTAQSVLTKTGTNLANGSIADSATGATGTAAPGDTVNWVLNYSNRAGAGAAVDLADPIKGQTFVPGSLVVPPGLTPKWSSNGGTDYVTSEPASGVNAVGAVGRIGSQGSVSDVSLGRPGFDAGNAGDGWEAVFYGGNLYNVQHHVDTSSPRGPLLGCHVVATGADCPGFRGGVFVSTTAGTPFSATPAGATATPMTPQSASSVLDPATGRLYTPVGLFETNQFGLLCSDLKTNTSCGFIQQGTTPWLQSNPGTYQIGTSGATGFGTRVYSVDFDSVVHCYDYATNASCGSVKGLAGYSNSAGEANGWNSRLNTFGNRIYVNFARTEVGGYASRDLLCVDPATMAVCPGYPIQDVTSLAVTPSGTGLYNTPMVPVLNTSGTVTGVCVATAGATPAKQFACYDLAGAPIADPYPTLPGLVGLDSLGDGVTVGTKEYLPIELPTGETQYACVDFSVVPAAACAGFNNPPHAGVRPYTLRADPSQPHCIYEVGDSFTIEAFNPESGAACSDSSALVTTDPASFYCDGKSGHVTGWKSMDIGGLTPAQYQGATVTIRDKNGVAVPGFSGLALPNGQQSLDVSSIPATGSTSSLTADVKLNGLDPAVSPAPTVSLNFAGDPAQVCFKTKMPTSCPTSVVPVSNTATAVTVGPDGTSDAPGSSSGAASFDVDFSALCQADLSVTKSTAAQAVLPGDTFTYTITVTNKTGLSATAPAVADTLPAGLTFVRASASGTASGQSVTWTDVVVPARGTTALTVTVRVADGTAYSTHFHNVVAVPISGDPTPGDNTATDDAAYTPNPGFALTKQICISGVPAECDPAVATDWVAQTTLPTGSTATYRIQLVNTGDVDLSNIVVQDTHPQGSKTVASLAVGATHTYTYTIPAAPEDTNTASATAVPAQCTGVCRPVTTTPGTASHSSAAYSVVKEVCLSGDPTKCRPEMDADWAAKGSLPLGSKATYRITVTNTGKADLANITVSDEHPEGTHTIAMLTAGSSHVFVYSLPVQADGDTNTVTTTAQVPGCAQCGSVPPAHQGSTATYDTGSFKVHKLVCTSGVPADCDPAADSDWVMSTTLPVGSTASYRITVHNTGTADLTNIKVTDTHSEGSRTIASLAAGTSTRYVYSLPVSAGGQTNIVTATGELPAHPSEAVEPVGGGQDSTAVLTPGYTVVKQVCVHNPDGPCRPGIDADWAIAGRAKAGKAVTFRVVVKNTGRVPLGPIVLTDTYSQGNHTIDTLAIAKSATYTYTLIAQAGPHTNTVTGAAQVSGCVSCGMLKADGGSASASYDGEAADQPNPHPSPRPKPPVSNPNPPVGVLPEKVGSSDLLAHTGGDTTALLLGSGVLVVGGLFLTVSARRRRTDA